MDVNEVEQLRAEVTQLKEWVETEFERYATYINETFQTLTETITQAIQDVLAPIAPLLAVMNVSTDESADETPEVCEFCGGEMTEDDETDEPICADCGLTP